MEPLKIKLTTLTPLWTGGVEMITDRLHETSLIGSLRWWYEAIARSLGYRACDVTRDKCLDDDPCVGCLLFGNTVRSRAFRWQTGGGVLAYQPKHPRDLIRIQPPNRTTGWFYGPGLVATDKEPINVNAIALRDASMKVKNYILTTLRVAENWGGLGAKTQHGYGVIHVKNLYDDQPMIPNVINFAEGEPISLPYPVLSDFFFAKFRLQNDVPANWWIRKDKNGKPILGVKNATDVEKWAGLRCGIPVALSVPISPAVKNQLRYGGILVNGKRQRSVSVIPVVAANTSGHIDKYIFGTTQEPLRSTKIHVSAAYQYNRRWEFRVWGWIPQQMPEERWAPRYFDHQKFLEELHEILTSQNFWQDVFGANIVDLSRLPSPAWEWREFKATRDTAGCFTSTRDFLNSLL